MIDLETLEKLHPEKYPRNDIGTSNLFATVWEFNLVYVKERKAFFTYNGKVWEMDIDDLNAHELAKTFTVSMIEYFRNKHPDDEDGLKYYSKYLARDKRVRLLNDVKSVSPISISAFDKQPLLINCQNCTVNIATGDVHKHDCILRPSAAAIPFLSGRFTEQNGRFVTIDYHLL